MGHLRIHRLGWRCALRFSLQRHWPLASWETAGEGPGVAGCRLGASFAASLRGTAPSPPCTPVAIGGKRYADDVGLLAARNTLAGGSESMVSRAAANCPAARIGAREALG